jgi:hypothetical protein
MYTRRTGRTKAKCQNFRVQKVKWIKTSVAKQNFTKFQAYKVETSTKERFQKNKKNKNVM